METETKSEDTSVEIRDLEVLNKQLTYSIEGKLCYKSPSPSKCCIFRVPQVLRRHDKDAYVPDTVSIGPFHHGKENLKPMEQVKLWYLHALLSRLQPLQNKSLSDLIKDTRDLEESARESYAGSLNINQEKFLEMMVIDGCFIIELFRKSESVGLRDSDDPIFNMTWMIPNLGHDLMLLENQLPWLVLERLFDLTKVPHQEQEQEQEQEHPSLTKLALSFFDFMMPMTVEPKPSPGPIKHLLDLLRNCLLSTSKFMFPNDIKLDLIPCATRLLDAGVNFKVGAADNILDIKFNNGVMEIPRLRINEITGSVFRNLIAYEQCDCDCTGRITSYAVLLSRLINSGKDVDLLSHKGILENWLSPEDVSLLFYRLYNDAGVYHFCYDKLCEQVNAYCQNDWHEWKATLKRDYFNSPWKILSFAAAVVLLLLTFMQTLFTVL